MTHIGLCTSICTYMLCPLDSPQARSGPGDRQASRRPKHHEQSQGLRMPSCLAAVRCVCYLRMCVFFFTVPCVHVLLCVRVSSSRCCCVLRACLLRVHTCIHAGPSRVCRQRYARNEASGRSPSQPSNFFYHSRTAETAFMCSL
jgi:hypothetical protein